MKDLLYKNIKTINITLFLIIIVFYSFVEARNLIRGPVVSIKSPIYGQTYQDQNMIVKGSAKNIKKISLNGRDIFLDKNGQFAEKLLMFAGYNIIDIVAEDKFGKIVSKKIEVTCVCDNT
jgi:hypothetical protein